MTIPADNFDRQAEAYAFLRGALSRCDQEGCAFLDVVHVVKSWADTKNIVTKPQWVAILTDRLNRPAVGDIVKISDKGSPCAGKIGKVAEIDDDNLGTLVQFADGNDSWYYDREVLVQPKPFPKPKVTRYIRLTKESPFPSVGSRVMISDRATIPQEWNDKIGDVLVVTESGPNVVWVDSGHMYCKTELLLVVEEE